MTINSTMILKFASLILCILYLTDALPTRERGIRHTLKSIDDSDSFDSSFRGTRKARSDDGNYHRSNEHEGDGEIGYSRKKTGGGKKGYQHFDSYHKKAGDNYEFEKQDSFGLDNGEQDGAYSDRDETTVKIADRDSSAPRSIEDFDEEHERFALEDVSSSREDKKKASLVKEKGDDDGNGGIEAAGHDPEDYILPERYTYGKEAALTYDF